MTANQAAIAGREGVLHARSPAALGQVRGGTIHRPARSQEPSRRRTLRASEERAWACGSRSLADTESCCWLQGCEIQSNISRAAEQPSHEEMAAAVKLLLELADAHDMR